VVRARRAPREVIQHSVSRLRPGSIQGVVFNDRPHLLPGAYRYGRLYRYGLGRDRRH